jgi:SPP1 family predicted phage head-tail adaptor
MAEYLVRSTYSVNAGDLRTSITLQYPTLTNDAGGAQVPGWANATTNPIVWARWVNAHGQEMVSSEALQSSQRAVVTIRHRADVLTTWRVLKDGLAWQIISVDPVRGRNHWLELVVEQAKGTV